MSDSGSYPPQGPYGPPPQDPYGQPPGPPQGPPPQDPYGQPPPQEPSGYPPGPPPGGPGPGGGWPETQPIEPIAADQPPGPPGPPPPPAPPAGGGRSKAPLIIAIVALLALILGAGGFLLLSGGDDDDEAGNGNGTEEDETTTTEEEEDETTTTEENGGGGEVDFEGVADDSGELVVAVPTDWTERDGRPVESGPNVQAAPDLQAFRDGFDVPGVSFGKIAFAPDPDVGLDFLGGFLDDGRGFDEVCDVGAREDYSDAAFVGRIQRFENCAGIGTTYIQVVASPLNSQDFSIEINFQLTVNDPPEIEDQILSTFCVSGLEGCE